MAAEHHLELDAAIDILVSASRTREEEWGRCHEAIETMLNAFSENDGYESGAHAVWAIHRAAAWSSSPGLLWEATIRTFAADPVT